MIRDFWNRGNNSYSLVTVVYTEVCTWNRKHQQTPSVSCFHYAKTMSVSLPHSQGQRIPILQLLCKIWSLVEKVSPFRLSLSLQLFVGELQLTVPSVAIQLWSRAVLQGCHDRINENNIAESHFIHITGERTQDLILKENVSVRVNRQQSDGDSKQNWN